jgi:ribosomal protein S18 acetylase RimI-like enzyme
MEPADLDFAAACIRNEGWRGDTRQSVADFLAYDPKGCLIAEIEGQRAGLCIATGYRHSGFIGELIVVPEQRRHGIGTALFTHAVDYLHSIGVSCIALDADAPGIPIYEKAGFRKMHRSLRFYGNVTGKANPSIRQMSPTDMQQICLLDAQLFGDDRSFFLRRILERCPEFCFIAEQDGELVGYLLARPGQGVLSVGPWALRPEQPHPLALLEQLALVVPFERLRIGVLETNQLAAALLRSTPGLAEGQACWRMLLGEGNSPGEHKWLYAVGSAAKG